MMTRDFNLSTVAYIYFHTNEDISIPVKLELSHTSVAKAIKFVLDVEGTIYELIPEFENHFDLTVIGFDLLSSEGFLKAKRECTKESEELISEFERNKTNFRYFES